MREALPPGTELLGGASGLGRAVAGTATFRARTPAFPALHGGELAIVPLALLRQVDPQTHVHLDRLVTQLSGAGIAAIVLVGAGVAGQAEEAMVVGSREAAASASDGHAIPLFIAPAGTTAEQVDLALHRHLAGRRATLLRRSQQLQQEFAQLALSGSGLAEIVERLAAVAGCPAAWEVAASLEPVVWAVPDASWTPPKDLARSAADLPMVLRAARLPLQRWSAAANGTVDSGEVAVLPLRADVVEHVVGAGAGAGAGSAGGVQGRLNGVAAWRRLVVAVRTGEGTSGFLSLISREGREADGGASEGRLALSAASLAVSIELMRTRTASEAQGSAQAGLVHDWLSGRLADDALEARAGQIGLALEPPYAVVLLEMGDGREQDDVRPLAGALGVAGPSLVASMGESLRALVVPIQSSETLTAAAVSLHAALERRAADGVGGRGVVFAGIGRVAATAAEVPRAFDEARRSLAVARRLGGAHRVAYVGTLGAYRVLASTDAEELAGFRAETLGPLLSADERGSADLLRTLEAYLACGGSPQETAQRLHTHRNTVLYRLQRLGDLLGMDVRAPEAQFTLWLALRAGDVLGERAAPVGVGVGVPKAAVARRTRAA